MSDGNTDMTKEDIILRWNIHLAKESPKKLSVLSIAFSLVVAAAYYAIGNIGAAIVAVVMISSFSDFLFPIKYQISNKEATSRVLFKVCKVSWKNVKHCYLDEYGVKLSTLPNASRLEAFRGVYLRFNNNNDQVIEIIKSLRA